LKGQKLFTNVHDVTPQKTLYLQQHNWENLYPFTCFIFSNRGGLNLYTLVHSTRLTVQSTCT